MEGSDRVSGPLEQGLDVPTVVINGPEVLAVRRSVAVMLLASASLPACGPPIQLDFQWSVMSGNLAAGAHLGSTTLLLGISKRLNQSRVTLFRANQDNEHACCNISRCAVGRQFTVSLDRSR